jgi:hypothetical protein
MPTNGSPKAPHICLERLNARGDGWSVDLASAVALRFEGEEFDRGRVQRVLGWGTLSLAEGGTTALALARYVGQDTPSEFKHGLDAGLKFIYADDRWGLSAEFVNRKIGDSAQRYAIGFDYRAFADNWLSATVGKDYGPELEGGLIALLNLQFNVGEHRLKEHQAAADAN